LNIVRGHDVRRALDTAVRQINGISSHASQIPLASAACAIWP
jgi:hypothetical protein